MGNKSKRIRVRTKRIAIEKMISDYWEGRLFEKEETKLARMAGLYFSPKKLDKFL